MDLGFGENDSGSGGVLDGESGSTCVAGYTTCWGGERKGKRKKGGFEVRLRFGKEGESERKGAKGRG